MLGDVFLHILPETLGGNHGRPRHLLATALAGLPRLLLHVQPWHLAVQLSDWAVGGQQWRAVPHQEEEQRSDQR